MTFFTIPVLTIRKISFRNIRGTQFPSKASLATNTWKDYSDTINIPAQILMENMDREAAQVVFLSMRNMESLLVPGIENSEKQKQIVNSQVIHIALGERSDLVRLTKDIQAVSSEVKSALVGIVVRKRLERTRKAEIKYTK